MAKKISGTSDCARFELPQPVAKTYSSQPWLQPEWETDSNFKVAF